MSNNPTGKELDICSDQEKVTININQLRVGLYVELDISWLNHPFLFRSFLIKNPKQLQALKKLGLKEITYDPSKSSAEPLDISTDSAPEVLETGGQELDKLWEEKNRRIECMKMRRQKMNQCNKKFEKSVAFMKKGLQEFRAHPKNIVGAAEQMVNGMIGPLLDDPDVAIHLVNIQKGGTGEYAHFTNVTVLSLMLGKAIGLDRSEMHALGVGALFHDIGTLMIPEKVLRKKGPLNQAERKFYKLHPEYGINITKDTNTLPAEALAVILHHHETQDGKGYPKGLRGEQIHKLAKVVHIADAYDLYCNMSDPDKSLSPYEAISYMFAKEKDKYDADMLSTFITSLGVYPPGTVVELSNDNIGQVVSINASDLLKPNIFLYNQNIPKKEAIIIDLREEEGLTVVKSIRPSQLPRKIVDYLSLETNINHQFDTPSQPN